MTTQLIESAGAGIGIMCTYCACTESSACDTPDGPCSWISTDPPVCSALDCQAKHEAKSREDVELANPPIAEREESTTAADLAAGDTEIAELGDPRDDGIQSAAPAARAVSDDRILEIRSTTSRVIPSSRATREPTTSLRSRSSRTACCSRSSCAGIQRPASRSPAST